MAEEKKSESQIMYLKGVGPKRAEILLKEGFYTPYDLVVNFPRAYVDRGKVDSLKALYVKLLQSDDMLELDDTDLNVKSEVTVVARIATLEVREFRSRKMLKIIIRDNTGGRANIVFWNYADYYKKIYSEGDLVTVSGKVEIDSFNQLNFSQPEIQKLEENSGDEEFVQSAILPIYSLSEKMKRSGINNRVLRTIIFSALQSELRNIKETLPEYLLNIYAFPALKDTLKVIHFPNNFNEISEARARMKFEEIFYFELYLALRHSGVKKTEKSVVINPKSKTARAVYESLSFDLTGDQKKVINEIMRDMASGEQMNRLLQGDVGSGKTIVSVLCMLSVIDDGYQVALMAPTEILAEQHYHVISKLVKDFDVNVVQLVGGQKKRVRSQVLEDIASGKANIIVGTHSLFESSVYYNKLGLAVIDEQHRFGVDQRAALKELGIRSHEEKFAPHILVMSATPIPRTLALTVYGDLDVSIIRQMPKGRQPISTKVVFESKLHSIYDFIKKEIAKGKQAYIVFPLVEKSEKLELKSAVEYYEELSNTVFAGYKTGLLHGQMLWYEKEDAMRDFLEKKYQILIATTVIEVGIDVPNATVMLINDAHRFGLSQLHQLRGRVGRGSDKSYCYLATKDNYKFEYDKNSDSENQKTAIIRLKTMERTQDGFELSEVDMKLRGPGDVLGTRQSGLPDFKFLDLASDGDIITQAKKIAFEIIEKDPQLRFEENSILKKTFNDKYSKTFNYFDIA